MKRLLIIMCLWAAVMAPVTITTTGCRSVEQSIKVSTITVDKAMEAWAIYVKDGKASLKQEQLVRDLLQQYQTAEDVALDAYEQYYETGDKSRWLIAKDLLKNNRQKLIDFITLITGN